jgi:hypothetical protein
LGNNIPFSKGDFDARRYTVVSTKKGDPILFKSSENINSEIGFYDIFITVPIAKYFDAKEGDVLTATVSRTVNGFLETQSVDLNVKGIIPISVLSNEKVFANLAFLEKVERYYENRPVPELNWQGSRTEDYPTLYQSFRLHASSLEAVERLNAKFSAKGILVNTNVSEIEHVKGLDVGFKYVFLTLLVVVGIGTFASAASGSIDQVAKNRKSLACLNLLGMGKFHLQIFSSLQVAISGFLAAFGACVLFYFVSKLINFLFYNSYQNVGEICSFSYSKLLMCIGIVVLFMILASLCAYKALSDIEPSEGMRDV